MAWSWSHSGEAYANVESNLSTQSREWLEECLAEILDNNYNEDTSTYEAQGNYPAILADLQADNLSIESLVEQIYEFACSYATCDNGGFNAYCCPDGCHTVTFDAPITCTECDKPISKHSQFVGKEAQLPICLGCVNQHSHGIDYSHGKSNVNLRTGIHFGVIPIHSVTQSWADCSEEIYPNPEYANDDPDDETFLPQDDMLIGYEYKEKGYHATQSADSVDILILQSPYYTHAQFCSPCAPGAGYLLCPCPIGPKTYCFGLDWFEDEIPPYPIFDVKTDKQVYPKEK